MHSRNGKKIKADVNNFPDLVFKYFACLYKNLSRKFPFFKIFSTRAVTPVKCLL